MAAYQQFLDWFDRHKFGVIGTLMLHTMLLAVFSLSSVGDRYPDPPPEPMVLDLQVLMPEPEATPETQEGQAMDQDVTNRKSNTTADASTTPPLSSAARQQMAEQVEQDLRAMEQEEFARLADARTAQGKDIVVPELDTTKFDKRNYMEEAAPTSKPKPVKVVGLTTVSYDLEGRTDIVLEVPAYLCKGQGKVVVRVEVDQLGNVRKAVLDQALSKAEVCMVEHALASASGARFSSSSTAAQPQRGSITYIFMAQ